MDLTIKIKTVLERINKSLENKKIATLIKNEPIGFIKDQDIIGKKLCGITTPKELAELFINTRLSTSTSTVLGNEIEELIELIIKERFGGYRVSNRGGTKSRGIDFEWFNNKLYILQFKLAPNWGNSASRSVLIPNFKNREAYHRLMGYSGNIECVLGIGNLDPSNKNLSNNTYKVYSGPNFWELITGDREFFFKLPEYCDNPNQYNFESVKKSAIDSLTCFLTNFSNSKGEVDYSSLLKHCHNSNTKCMLK